MRMAKVLSLLCIFLFVSFFTKGKQEVSALETGNMPNFTLKFDGTDDFVFVPFSTSLNLTNALTIEAWIKRNSLGNHHFIISKGGQWNSYELHIIGGEYPARFILNSPETCLDSKTSVGTTGWYHIAATYDGQKMKIYINGVVEDSVPFAGPINSTSSPVCIGKRVQDGGSPFDGMIDEVRIWNIARTQQQIQSTMYCELDSGSGYGLVSVWHFNEGFGQTVYDPVSGNSGRLGSTTDNDPQDPIFISPGAVQSRCFKGVNVTAGSSQAGPADTDVDVVFYVQSMEIVPDTFDLNITDSLGWTIVPTYYEVPLDSGEIDTVTFAVSIPYVPISTVDKLTLTAASQTDSTIADTTYLMVTCDAHVESWDILAGNNMSGLSNSQVTAKFYIQNTGLAADSCSLTVSDSLGWDIQPTDFKLILDSGQQDSVFLDISIPSVPVGTADKITLNGISITNPFVIDSASLLVTCESYNVFIANISDVGNDQGRQVSMDWKSFPGSDPLVTHFTIFRRVDSLYLATLGVHPKLFSSLDYPPGNWQMIGTYPAYGETLYSIVAPTLKDSTISEGMYWSVFFIRAGTDTPTVYFDSPIDSGYSLDNLLPSPPIDLLARHKPAVTQLTWAKCEDADFDYHTLYRDTTSEFQPTLDNMLSYAVDSIFVDSTAQFGKEYYYLVSATDFSGNESTPSNAVMGVRYITGDANASGEVDIIDVVHLINYLFRQGPEPTPLESGDVNCAGEVTIADAVYLIRYLFKGFDPPCEPEE